MSERSVRASGPIFFALYSSARYVDFAHQCIDETEATKALRGLNLLERFSGGQEAEVASRQWYEPVFQSLRNASERRCDATQHLHGPVRLPVMGMLGGDRRTPSDDRAEPGVRPDLRGSAVASGDLNRQASEQGERRAHVQGSP